MGQVRMKVLFMFFIFLFSLSQHVAAEEPNEKLQSDILSHVQNAFEAQVSLTEEPRSKEEIERILEEYFFDSFIKVYLKENVESVNNQYIVYGTDFPKNTIPFFQYSEETVIEIVDEQAMIYEYFEANNEGPVSYEDHYEVVFLKKTNNNWKISSIEDDVNKPFLNNKPVQSNMVTQDLIDTNVVNGLSTSEAIEFNHFNLTNATQGISFLSTYLLSKNLINDFYF
ncbi:ribosomal protein S8 [Metabacillus crassostreae]|uniref:DUF3993 domain-containing protein n=1 Tax=Metabacillus crassostreae TaxID=929098 RepID=UPI00195A3DAC|nr:DUF3993 domain-containing protein [Metabacillus crassostreae]MBM7603572.1 ribosomal protein S8 [Metabacillus crassostreae]